MQTITEKLPVVIAEKEILQPNRFEAGPRITKIQTIQMPDGSIQTVRFWSDNNGNLVMVN